MTRSLGAAVLSLLVVVACAPTSSDRADDPQSGESSGESSAERTRPTAEPPPEPISPARRATSVLTPEAPTALTLPGGVEVAIRPAATARDGRLAVPDDIEIAGWWEGSARVGDPFGSVLIAAHVDSTERGLGPFAGLLSMEKGDRVVLDGARLTQDFVVDSLRLVPQGPLTTESSLFAADGPLRLTLVTCAPPYVRARGGYQNLAVVTALPVAPPTRGRPR